MIWILLLSSIANAWTHLGTNIRGWSSGQVVFSVNPTNCTLSEAALYDVIDRSLNAWNGVPTSKLSLSRNPVPSTTTLSDFLAGIATDAPVIVCSTDMGTSADGSPGYMTALATNSSGEITYAGIVLNSDPTGDANIANLSSAELSITLAHEIGHALGIGHSGVLQALMYYSISNKPDAILTEDDMDAVTAIYPKSDFTGSPMGCSAVHAIHDEPTFAREQLTELAFLALFFVSLVFVVKVVVNARS